MDDCSACGMCAWKRAACGIRRKGCGPRLHDDEARRVSRNDTEIVVKYDGGQCCGREKIMAARAAAFAKSSGHLITGLSARERAYMKSCMS